MFYAQCTSAKQFYGVWCWKLRFLIPATFEPPLSKISMKICARPSTDAGYTLLFPVQLSDANSNRGRESSYAQQVLSLVPKLGEVGYNVLSEKGGGYAKAHQNSITTSQPIKGA